MSGIAVLMSLLVFSVIRAKTFSYFYVVKSPPVELSLNKNSFSGHISTQLECLRSCMRAFFLGPVNAPQFSSASWGSLYLCGVWE